jgi:tetratricopeptide (TPR) repeat protein
MVNKQNFAIVVFIFFFFFGIIPLGTSSAASPESVYTIQVASFNDTPTAQEKFDSLVQTVDKKNLDHLRIEKIGKYYSLRLGKFKKRNGAEQLLEQIRSHIPSSMIMKAYYKDERIVKVYRYTQESVAEDQTEQKPVKQAVKREPVQTIKPLVDDKAQQKERLPLKESPLKDKIKTVAGFVDKRDFSSALTVVKNEIATEPENPELNAWYGAVLLKMNNPAEALQYLKKAVQLSPEVSDYHNGLGYCFFFLNRTDSAIDEFNKALSIEPGHIDALTGLGIVYAQSGKKDKATDI